MFARRCWLGEDVKATGMMALWWAIFELCWGGGDVQDGGTWS